MQGYIKGNVGIMDKKMETIVRKRGPERSRSALACLKVLGSDLGSPLQACSGATGTVDTSLKCRMPCDVQCRSTEVMQDFQYQQYLFGTADYWWSVWNK